MIKRITVTLLSFAMLVVFTSCGSTNTPKDGTSTTEGSSNNTSTIDSSTPDTAVSDETTTDIVLHFGDTEITATLSDSETTKAFLEKLPMTLTMSRYADREYYAAMDALPEGGEVIEDYENGDVTFYTAGSLAIYFAGEETSNQSGLIRMGKITSDLSLFDAMPDTVAVTITLAEKGNTQMGNYDFSAFSNVEITGIDISALTDEELSVLHRQARYCQAMTKADIDTMTELVAEDVMFTHMSGMQQTRTEYFADIENGSLRYFTIGIENPVIEVNGRFASITYTSVLNANAYGARGTYRMTGTHRFERINEQWVSTNAARTQTNG